MKTYDRMYGCDAGSLDRRWTSTSGSMPLSIALTTVKGRADRV